jgi:hypothetical protein
MLKYILFVVSIILIKSNFAFTQRVSITLSGQNIKQQFDGTWIKNIMQDTLPLLIDAQNPKEHPFQPGTPDFILSSYATLMKAAQKSEIESFAAIDFIELSISQNEITLSKAKLSKDKILIKETNAIIKEQIKEKNKANKKYQNIFEKILEIRNLPLENVKDQENNIKQLSYYFNIKMDMDTNKMTKDKVTNVSNNMETLSDCTIIRDEIKLKRRILEIGSIPIFTFTPSKLKSYFKEKELMQAQASFLKLDKNYFLKLSIKLISKDASNSYGYIAKESMLNIDFITGKKEVLYALDSSPAQFENYTGHTLYHILYPVPQDILKIMTDVPLNTISMMWSSGYETYDIYDVDALMSQLKCIKSIK